MSRRIGITIVTTLLAVFGIGHVRAFVTHGQFGCAAASAQQGSDDGGSGASESYEVSTEPEKAKTPPDVAGDWSGEADDAKNGASTIDLHIDQNVKKLSGTWSAPFGDGSLNGSIDSEGAINTTLKVEAGCHIKVVGLLVAAGEITGTYKWNSCGKSLKGDHGTFDITD